MEDSGGNEAKVRLQLLFENVKARSLSVGVSVLTG